MVSVSYLSHRKNVRSRVEVFGQSSRRRLSRLSGEFRGEFSGEFMEGVCSERRET